MADRIPIVADNRKMKEETASTEQSHSGLGPGDRLQAARISIDLTIKDVANKMHLSTSILTSLEENSFEVITAPIFVKGYLRSYARIVNISESDIIDQYNQYYTDGDPPISSTSNATPEINAGDARVKWATSLVILILLALLSLWWWNQYHQPAETLSLNTSSQAEKQNQPADNEPAQAQQENIEIIPEVVTQQETIEEPQNEEPVTIEPQPEQVMVEAESETLDMPPTADDPVETTDEQPVEENLTTSEQVEGAMETEPDDPVALNEDLVITVISDTWADIREADGNKLIYDLLHAGELVSISGQAPLSVFLGNGYGVSIKYMGEEIDLTPHIRSDNTARIKLER